MPLYDYKCASHGVFQELVPLADFDQPCACPQCGTLSPRVILFSPQFLAMAEERRKAFATNEKARHEPVFSNRDVRAEAKKQHGTNCGCHSTQPLSQARQTKLFYTAEGDKMFPSMRPWMISH